MKTLCCVCGETIKDGPELQVSHGYCTPCLRAFMADNDCSEDEINGVVKKVNEKRWSNIWK